MQKGPGTTSQAGSQECKDLGRGESAVEVQPPPQPESHDSHCSSPSAVHKLPTPNVSQIWAACFPSSASSRDDDLWLALGEVARQEELTDAARKRAWDALGAHADEIESERFGPSGEVEETRLQSEGIEGADGAKGLGTRGEAPQFQVGSKQEDELATEVGKLREQILQVGQGAMGGSRGRDERGFFDVNAGARRQRADGKQVGELEGERGVAGVYVCDFRCGFRGSYVTVAHHEEQCPNRPKETHGRMLPPPFQSVSSQLSSRENPEGGEVVAVGVRASDRDLQVLQQDATEVVLAGPDGRVAYRILVARPVGTHEILEVSASNVSTGDRYRCQVCVCVCVCVWPVHL